MYVFLKVIAICSLPVILKAVELPSGGPTVAPSFLRGEPAAAHSW